MHIFIGNTHSVSYNVETASFKALIHSYGFGFQGIIHFTTNGDSLKFEWAYPDEVLVRRRKAIKRSNVSSMFHWQDNNLHTSDLLRWYRQQDHTSLGRNGLLLASMQSTIDLGIPVLRKWLSRHPTRTPQFVNFADSTVFVGGSVWHEQVDARRVVSEEARMARTAGRTRGSGWMGGQYLWNW